jgi:hypothetical protein
MRIVVLSVALLGTLAACSEPGPFDEANRLLKMHVADDILLTIDPASESRHPHADGTYSVCGKTRVKEPGAGAIPATDDVERFMVNVRGGDGVGYFDGSDDPDAKASFQKDWDRLCGAGSESQNLSPD